jgi:MFS family permease
VPPGRCPACQPELGPLAFQLTDVRLLFATRIIRLFAYGFVSVVLALYLAQAGFGTGQIGLIFSLALAGDAVITLWLTTSADRVGRKRILITGALLMILAGLAFTFARNWLVLAMAAIIGVISPSGNEIGPFLSVEQASLTQLLPDARRTQVFAWYTLAGSFAGAAGALAGGWLAQLLQHTGASVLASYRAVLAGYVLAGVLLYILFLFVSSGVEVPVARRSADRRILGLHRSQKVVFGLSALFAMDAFAGALIVQSFLAYWFQLRFGVPTGVIGTIFFATSIVGGLSALLAAWLARHIGLINTMVFTHIPSSIFLMLVPLMPTLPLSAGFLILRASISQMDVPTRQSYTMAVVEPDERSAASGVTTIARSVGAAASPVLSGVMLSSALLFNLPFFLAGCLKIAYDLLLYFRFRRVKPPEERSQSRAG